MRVTFCAYDRPGYVGGPNAGLIRLLPELRQRGVDAQCLFLTFASDDDCPTIQALKSADVPYNATRYHETTELRIQWLLEQIKDNPPDILVPNLMPAAYFAARWCREAGISTIGVIRNVDGFYEGLLEEFAFGPSAFRQTAFVGVSAEGVEMIRQEQVGLAAIEQIPSPVIMPDESVDYDGGELRIAYSGRMVERQKQISRTVRAFCAAAENVPGTEYSLFGGGPDAGRAQAELDRCGKGLPVKMIGRINPPEMGAELMNHHCVALLSDYEGLPLALMEAMASGLVPIGLSSCRGVAELVENGVNGLLIDDAERDFADAVARLKDNPELFRRLSAASRDRIRTVSELDFVADKWLALFATVKGAEGSRHPLRIPVAFDLPPVNSKLASEDDREESPQKKETAA